MLQNVSGVEVLVEGEGERTILMIHGWPDTRRLWDPQVAALRDRFRCARFTLPGFEAGAPRRAVPLAEMVSLIGAVADAVSPERPLILMLHDWGCVFGGQFQATRPDRVDRVVSVDIGDARSVWRSWWPHQLAMVLAYQFVLALAWALGRAGDAPTRAMARALGFPGDRSAVHSGMNYPYFIQWTGTHGSYFRLRPFLPECPIFFAYGRRKPLPFHGRAWAERLAARPQNRVVGFDCGHWVTVEAAEAFNRAVGEWLGEG